MFYFQVQRTALLLSWLGLTGGQSVFEDCFSTVILEYLVAGSLTRTHDHKDNTLMVEATQHNLEYF